MAVKVLAALDSAKTQYYHFKAIIVAGMGLFTDAYDLFCIPPIMKLLGRIYYTGRPNHEVPASVSSAMVGTALLGTVIGKLLFGYLGDRIGRRRVYGLSLMLMVLSSIWCGFSMCTSRACVLLTLGFFRFALGVGIGGDYPLSATIMSEFANRRTRGAFIAAVFSMQGFGILVSSTVTMVVCTVFDRATRASPEGETPEVADLAWRLILMFAAVPAGVTYYWRMTMPETPRYTALVEKNVEQAVMDMQRVLAISLNQIAEDEEENPSPNKTTTTPPPNSYSLFSKEFLRRHGRDLFACAATWGLVDMVFYSSNLFQSKIYDRYLPKRPMNVFQEAFHVAKLQAIIAVCSTIPGYYATVYFIDRVGRVRIQIMGFFFMALGLLAIGIPYQRYWHNTTNIGFMVLYSLTFFFANFGPNTTTFIVPAELFPARFRSTCHGISGAVGKMGAIVGSVGLMWGSRSGSENGCCGGGGIGMTASLEILGGVCVVGMMVTYFFTRETMGRSLEENESEDETSGVCFLRCVSDPCARPHSPPVAGA